jgi:hypothetical protein
MIEMRNEAKTTWLNFLNSTKWAIQSKHIAT